MNKVRSDILKKFRGINQGVETKLMIMEALHI